MDPFDERSASATPIPLLFAVCLALTTSVAHAQTSNSTDGRADPDPRINPSPDQPGDKMGPRIGMAKTLMQDGGLENPILSIETPMKPISEDGIGATLRFDAPPADPTLERLREAGIRFQTRDDGSLVRVGSIYSAFVPWEAYDELEATPNLERAEAAWFPSHASPLEDTGKLVGAEQIRRQTNLDHNGEGIVIGDVDSNFDIYHPHFFRADGGTYHWRDLQKDGEALITPGTDGVDVDGNGTVDDDETLRVIDGATLEGSSVDGANQTFEPRTDWLYIDTNGDGRRNVGADAGFSESTPAYGEPIFVADDVDRDGTLEKGEPLVRLDTPKFRRVVRGDEVYRRGEDLIEFGIQPRDTRPTHGTSTMSVLVGGQPKYHDRVGLAPAAEVVGYGYTGIDRDRRNRWGHHLNYLQDAGEGDVDIMLHEWSDVKSSAMDGSSNVETAMDELSSQGILQVTPMGNLNTSGKHTETSLEPGQTTEVSVEVTEGLQRRGQTVPYRLMTMALYWRQNGDLDLTVTSPAGNSLQLDDGPSEQTLGDATVASQTTVSSGGTRHAVINIYNRNDLAQGDWSVQIDGIERAETLVGRLGDGYTSWGRGLVWNDETRNHGTLCFPASADSAIGVAAYGAKGRGGSAIGELQGYSSRGPRIDGKPVVDLTAPSDALAAFGLSPAYRDQGFRRGWFRQFGGTSGAGPHVAGSAALLMDAHPDWSSSKIKQELRDHAVTSSLEPFGESLPNRHWGAGKIDAYRALTGNPAPEFTDAPSAALQVDVGGSKVTIDASGSSAPQAGALEYRFDVENDGEWDTSWRGDATAEAPLSAYEDDRNDWARVEVRTQNGLRDGALTSFDIQSDQTSHSSSGGCGGCRTSDSRPISGSWLLALAGLLVARFRRSDFHRG